VSINTITLIFRHVFPLAVAAINNNSMMPKVESAQPSSLDAKETKITMKS
jgi:hypothetical protein